ncbi:CFEM domain-containing protein [Phlyctema vagabunda]|uniref:CFEM domain-containing protein n=1 Tax=Phlyctema vagabunda TaxID=108571 RepID=A0ABR4P808_9HELO
MSSAGFGAVAMGSVLVRLWARWKLFGRFGADDWVIAVAGILCLVFTILGCVAVFEGFGLNIWDIPADRISTAFKVFYIDEPFYVALLALTKVSIILFLLRIFPTRNFRISAYIVMGYVTIFGIALTLTATFQCIPISTNWKIWKERHDHSRPRCISANTQSYVHSATCIIQDILILGLPIPSLVMLKVARIRKFDLFLMFGIGILVTVVSCVRLQFLVLFAKSDNLTWDNSDAMYWSAMEVFASFLITSLPAIRALLSDRFPSWFSTAQRISQPGEDPKPSSSHSHTPHALHRIDNARLNADKQKEKIRIHVVIEQQRLERSMPLAHASSSHDLGEIGVRTYI